MLRKNFANNQEYIEHKKSKNEQNIFGWPIVYNCHFEVLRVIEYDFFTLMKIYIQENVYHFLNQKKKLNDILSRMWCFCKDSHVTTSESTEQLKAIN